MNNENNKKPDNGNENIQNPQDEAPKNDSDVMLVKNSFIDEAKPEEDPQDTTSNEVLPIQTKVVEPEKGVANKILNTIQNTKIGKKIPLYIREVETRDLEFLISVMKIVYFVPFSLILSSISSDKTPNTTGQTITKWAIIPLFFYFIESIFSVYMFFMSSLKLLPHYYIAMALKIGVVFIYTIISIYRYLSIFKSVLITGSLAIFLMIDYLNIFYLRNSCYIKAYQELNFTQVISEKEMMGDAKEQV